MVRHDAHQVSRPQPRPCGRFSEDANDGVLLGQALDTRRKMQAREIGHLAGNHAEGKGDVATLPEGVDAEPRQTGNLIRGVEFAGLLERGDAAWSQRAA